MNMEDASNDEPALREIDFSAPLGIFMPNEWAKKIIDTRMRIL